MFSINIMSCEILLVQIRLATHDDLLAINDIYNHYVLTSTATYQELIEPMDDRRRWFEKHQSEAHPATVAQTGAGEIVGWGALSPWRDRSAYRFSVENSVYVRHDLHGRGIGSALLADRLDRGALRLRQIDDRPSFLDPGAEHAPGAGLLANRPVHPRRLSRNAVGQGNRRTAVVGRLQFTAGVAAAVSRPQHRPAVPRQHGPSPGRVPPLGGRR